MVIKYMKINMNYLTMIFCGFVLSTAACSDHSLEAKVGGKNAGPAYIVYKGDEVINADPQTPLVVRVSHFMDPEEVHVQLKTGSANLLTTRGTIALKAHDE